jgi:hypothetical protein
LNFGVPGPDGTGGGYALGPQFLPFSGFFGLAVPFQPTADYTLDTIRIPITCNPNSALNQFIVELYDGATQPATVLERYSRSVSGFSVVELDSSLHPVLYAGHQYWVAVSTVASGQWGWGGLVHPPGTVLVMEDQSSLWTALTIPNIPTLLPGLFVAGASTTVRAPSTVFANGGSVPQFVAGGGWQTTFVLVNTGATPATAGLNFFDDSGSPLSVPLVYPNSTAPTSASSISEQLAGGASVSITASDTGATQQGYATFTTDGEVGALTIFRYNPTGQEIGVPLETRNANSYLVAFDDTGGISTCVAIANLSAVPASVPVTIRDQSGALLQSTTINLPASGHTAFELTGQYPITQGQQGVIEFDTPDFGSISVFGLRTAPIGSAGSFSLATIPVVAR